MSLVLFINGNGDEEELHRRRIVDAENPFELDNTKFIRNFRLNKSAFKYVLDELTPEIQSRTSLSIPPIIMLATTLRFVAEGGYQFGVGKDQNINLSQSSVSNCIQKVITLLEMKLCSKWIKFQSTDEEKEETKLHFYEKYRFPGVIGCIDGTHVAITPPTTESRHLFYNRKGFFSLNVIVCDQKMQIRYIDASHPGATHDALVWRVSEVRNFLLQQYSGGRQTNSWLLGDSGYPLEPWLMTPYRSPNTESQESKFNIQHSKAQNIVERTIGILKNRFRCCLKARQLHYSPEKAGRIINVCAALHNVCIHFKVADDVEHLQDLAVNAAVSLEVENESTYVNEARNARDRIAQLF